MILCCGDTLIDMLPRLTTAGEQAFAPYVGGALFNSAIALGRIGAPTGLLTGLSSDFFGQMLRAALAESHVDAHFAHISDRHTTLAFVRLVEGQASYTFFDEDSAGRMLYESDLPELDGRVEAMLFGCMTLIAEPSGSTYEALMRREHKKRVMMLDPNIRKDFVPDKTAHMARMRRMIALADIVKLSDEDLGWFGETGTDAQIAARWLAMGPKLVAITHGAKGAKGYTERFEVSVPARVVSVADTVGAGDTFNAGILASLSEMGLLTKEKIAGLTEKDVTEALEFAARIAAITVSRAGANPPWAYELA
ncbi:MAG: carbohydrate kinase [Rhizobiaceae bacterium]|nr:MAG: carbohydrate kinase [Rhizobiaceae bacterium]